MGNWSSFKTISVIVVCSIFSLSGIFHTYNPTWGFFGHKRINRIAVFTLPPEMFGFYKEHLEYLTDHAVDPDMRRYAVEGEAQCHYIDLDHYYKPGDPPPSADKTWVVEKILGHRVEKGRQEWLVKWKGYDTPDWQPIESFCPGIQMDWLKYVKRMDKNPFA
jgi:hypothetical protein